MKKLLALALFISVFATASIAQEVAKPVGSMREEVGLTKDVDTKIKIIKERYKEPIEKLRADAAALDNMSGIEESEKKNRKKELTAKRKDLEASREKEIRALLTQEQQLKYDEYLQKKRAEKANKKAAAEAVHPKTDTEKVED